MATTYYRDDAVHVSSGGVRVGEDWYPLRTLTYVWHRRTGKLRHGAYMAISRTAAVGLILAIIVGGGILARRVDLSGDQKTMLIAGGVLGVVLIGGLAAFGIEGVLQLLDRSNERNRGVHEIWVRCARSGPMQLRGDRPRPGAGDHEIMIFATTDSTRFGQIYRALQRAIEHGS